MRSWRRGGFTLVELLTVLVVLGILATMLVPRLVRARMKALHSACVTNVRNVGTAVQAYANDHRGRFPTDLDALTEGTTPPLRLLPTCPSGDASYETLYQVNNPDERYTIACNGLHHLQLETVRAGFPQFYAGGRLDATGEP